MLCLFFLLLLDPHDFTRAPIPFYRLTRHLIQVYFILIGTVDPKSQKWGSLEPP